MHDFTGFRFFRLCVTVWCVGIGAVPALGQTVQGVRIDAAGVMKTRAIANHSLKLDQRLDPEWAYVSLPKLFNELQRLMEAGQELPERLRFLDGLVKIERIYAYPDRGDLILAGPAEPWDASDPLRVRGRRTGRPVITLDDLALALRQFGPTSRSRVFGCTLLQDKGASERVAKLQRQILAKRVSDQSVIAQALKESLGPLTAEYFGVPTDTRFALTCVESDYLMKRLSLGLDPIPVPGFKSYLERSGSGHLFNRFWFVADYAPLLVSPDGLTIQFPERGLGLRTSDSETNQGTKNDGAARFSKDFTDHMARLEAAIPAFADLHNLTDLAVVATLIAKDDLAKKTHWDMSWILDSKQYQIAKVTTPTKAETLVNIRRGRGRGVTVAGGVRVDPVAIVKSRKVTTARRIPLVEMKTSWSRRITRPADR